MVSNKQDNLIAEKILYRQFGDKVWVFFLKTEEVENSFSHYKIFCSYMLVPSLFVTSLMMTVYQSPI